MSTRSRLLLATAIVLAFALLVACGGDGNGDDPTTTPSPRAATHTPTTDPPDETPTPAPSSPTLIIQGPAPGEDITGNKRLYLALGDSLSEGIAASDSKRTAWVPLVATGLGDSFELINLGVAGHDSEELIEEGPLTDALEEIAARRDDAVRGNEVAVITLEIGGNDLLDIFSALVLPGTCPTVEESLQKSGCVEALDEALAAYQPNLRYTIEALQAAAPGVPVFLMTLYNPFSGGAAPLDALATLALEGQPGTPFPEGLNDIIRSEAAAHPGVVLVEWYEAFLGKQPEYIASDIIHPNDTGYAVMAEIVLEAMAAAGLP